MTPPTTTTRTTPRASLTGPRSLRAGRHAVLHLTLSSPKGVVTGTTTWRVDGKVACRTRLVHGRAQCRTGALRRGQHRVVVSYAGSSAYTAVTARTAIRVRR